MEYFWTKHAKEKLKFYNLSEARIHRVIRHPHRVEEGIAENTIAVMAPNSLKRKNGKMKWSQEIWAMFVKTKDKVKVISAWRYPGVSPKRNPIPQEILDEIKGQGYQV